MTPASNRGLTPAEHVAPSPVTAAPPEDSGSATPAVRVTPLSFGQLSEVNVQRARRWHPGFPANDTWNGADWSNAMCGEAGEAANVVKKLRRIETGHQGTRPLVEADLLTALGDELADVVIYADLLAAKYGIDLSGAIVRKFNEVSERQGFPERLDNGAEQPPAAERTKDGRPGGGR